MQKPQLKMIWSPHKLDQPPVYSLPAGYEIRLGDEGDDADFVDLMAACGWEFGQERLDYCKSKLLPAGWFLVTEPAGTQLAASAMSLHNYSGRSTCAGTLGWVGCRPEHRGQGLGTVVTAAATARLLQSGYKHVELYTEHFRLPAIATYFRLGYIPYIYNQAVAEVWQEVCVQINQTFAPDQWVHGDNAYPKNDGSLD